MKNNKHILILATFISFISLSYNSLQAEELFTYPMVKEDPRFSKIPDRKEDHHYQVMLRLIDHKSQVTSDEINRLVMNTEQIYSQCPGVRFHVKVVAQKSEPGNILTTHLTKFVSAPKPHMEISPEFIRFFTPAYPTKKDDVIDIHLVEDLNLGSGGTTLGQAFHKNNLKYIFADSRKNPDIPHDQIGGDTILLAIGTMKKTDGNWGGLVDEKNQWRQRGKEYNSSLLAHELGHLLVETQDAKVRYRDHFCPAINDDCADNNFLSAGGYVDRVFVNVKNEKRVIGYSPLPKIDPIHCEALIHHPTVKRID